MDHAPLQARNAAGKGAALRFKLTPLAGAAAAIRRAGSPGSFGALMVWAAELASGFSGFFSCLLLLSWLLDGLVLPYRFFGCLLLFLQVRLG